MRDPFNPVEAVAARSRSGRHASVILYRSAPIAQRPAAVPGEAYRIRCAGKGYRKFETVFSRFCLRLPA
ncbi:MAG: hypothetical protein AB7V53_12235 [Dongiaceae bacterium]